MIEAKFEERGYSAAQAHAVLAFDTESVPLQMAQARCADQVLLNAEAGHFPPKARYMCRIPAVRPSFTQGSWLLEHSTHRLFERTTHRIGTTGCSISCFCPHSRPFYIPESRKQDAVSAVNIIACM